MSTKRTWRSSPAPCSPFSFQPLMASWMQKGKAITLLAEQFQKVSARLLSR